MSEFKSANSVNRTSYHPSHHFFFSIPFGKAVSLPPAADDDLFPPIRPPADVTAPQAQADDTEEGEDATPDADADADDAMMGDGSDASEESDEVSSSVQK
jgi:hypothetical protein